MGIKDLIFSGKKLWLKVAFSHGDYRKIGKSVKKIEMLRLKSP